MRACRRVGLVRVGLNTRETIENQAFKLADSPSGPVRLDEYGNSVRNVTACPYAGVCPDEVFDVTPYSKALSKFRRAPSYPGDICSAIRKCSIAGSN